MNKMLKLLILTTLATAPISVSFASNYKGEIPMQMPLIQYSFVPKWYVGGNIGVSRTHDRPRSPNSITQIGPGWSVDLGYQFLECYRALFAGELGFTQYYHSSETLPRFNIANTEHFGAYLAAVAQYPLGYNFNILGKLGVTYTYAKKVFTASGASGSANTYSPYYGLGLSYNATPSVALIAQWNRARGNSSTGSTDLSSLGVSYSFG